LVLFIVSDDETVLQLMERGFSNPQHPEGGCGAGVDCAGMLAICQGYGAQLFSLKPNRKDGISGRV
jgi:hypothetical protein